MYFLITGTYQDEEGGGTFEWVIEAADKEAALGQLDERYEIAYEPTWVEV